MVATAQPSHQARQVARSEVVTRAGRIGLVGYGVVHLLIAFLAIRIATGSGGEEASKSGALATVAEQPFGRFLLWTIAVGLAAMTLWQLGEAVWGHRRGGAARHVTRGRLTSLGEAALFGFLAYTAGTVAAGGSSGGSKTQTATGALLEQPAGQALVVALGLAILAVAAFVVRHGVTKAFREHLDLTGANPRTRQVVERLGQVGYSALGVAYGVVGGLVVAAAVSYDPAKAAGFDGAIRTIAAQPFGALLLWVVALGLACYGVYCFFDARFRRA